MAHFAPDEVKILQLAGPIFIKMLQDKERKLLLKLHGAYRNGAKDNEFRDMICEFSVIREMQREILNPVTQQQGDE